MHKLIALCTLFLLWYSPAGAQTTAHLPFRIYTSEQGLSSSAARKTAEDPYGFIWIATQDGLNRFDGKQFIHFTKNSRQQLAGNDVSSILVDTANNCLWVATALGGLEAIDLRTLAIKQRFLFHQEGSGMLNDWVQSMLLIRNQLWLGTNNGLFIYDIEKNKVLRKLPAPPGLKNQETLRYDNLVSISETSVAALINNSHIVCHTPAGEFSHTIYSSNDDSREPTASISDITLLNKTLILASTDKGLLTIPVAGTDTTKARRGQALPFNLQSPALYAYPGEDGILWIATASGLFHASMQTGSLTRVYASSKTVTNDWEGTVSHFFPDSAGNLWLSSSHGVLISPRNPGPLSPFHSMNNDALKIGRSFNIFYQENSDCYISTEKGLIICDGYFSKGSRIDPDLTYYSVMPVMNRTLAFGSAGIKLVQGNRTVSPQSVFPELASISQERIGVWLRFDDSTILLASYVDKGVWKWDLSGRHVSYIETDLENGFQTDQVNALYKETDSTVIIVCLSKLFRHNPGRKMLTEIPVKSRPGGCIFYDIVKRGMYYFVGTYGDGVLVYDTDFRLIRQITSLHGLPNNNIYNFYSFNDSSLLASTNYGAALIHVRNFSVHPFLITDGLSSNNLESNYHPFYSNDKTFIPSLDGITQIQPSLFSGSGLQPKIYFTGFSMGAGKDLLDSTNLGLAKIIIPSHILNLTIHFSGLYFPDPVGLRYVYRIPQFGHDWIDAGNKNFIDLIGLSPGTYHLQIQAFNQDGTGSEIKELTLLFLPKWYQTWWFKSLIGLLVIAMGYGLYRLRINQLKKEEKIRNQLASDLHDDLGSTLNSIKVHSNLALMEKDNPNHLVMIKQGAQDAISGVRDIIWVLDDKKDLLTDMLARVSQFAAPLCEANKISYQVDIKEDARELKLGKEEKRNLYLIIKETINNSLKYADAKNILLLVSRPEKKLRIELRDDGKGFDSHNNTAGYGLRNILNRAAAVGYTATIDTSPGKGVVLLLEKT